jgi:DNA polymerase elongation subunit (family B)
LNQSIILGKNIDYSTLVTDDDIPNRMCNVIEWSEHCGCEHDKTKRKTKPKHKLCGDRKFRFLKEPKGIMPTLLENLLTARKETKKEIKEVENKIKTLTDEKEIKELELYLSVLDKRQLAFKVCANSGYGAMGVKDGYLPFMPGAMCTTAVGRQSIETVAKYIPEKFNGTIVYGDTDSNYVYFPNMNGKSISEIWKHALMVAQDTSSLFPKPMKLEFEEKIYTKFLILTKKRYMCLSCKEDGIVGEKIDKKGVLLARRDNSKAVRDIYSNIIMKIFYKESEDNIIYELTEIINKLCSGVLPAKDFVITKAVGDVNKMEITDISTVYKKGAKNTMKEIRKGKMGDYVVEMLSSDPEEKKRQLDLKNAENDYEYYLHCLPAQVQLAQKMRRRGQIVDVGSRLEFVVITDGTVYNIDKEKQYEKLEDIVYYMNHSDVLQIDYLYYLKALSNPMDQVLNIICKNTRNFVYEQYKYRLHRVKLLAELKSLFNPVITLID